MPEHTRDHDVVLEQAHREHGDTGGERRDATTRSGRRRRRPAPAASGPTTGTISTMPAKMPTSSQYGTPMPRSKREHGRRRARSGGADRARTRRASGRSGPRCRDDAALRPRQRRETRSDRPVALEDPVGGGREDEEHADERLERLARHVTRRGDEPAPTADVRADAGWRRGLCLIPSSASPSGRAPAATSARRRPPADLVERARDDEPDEERDRPRSRRSGARRRAARGMPKSASRSTPGRIAAAMTKPRNTSAITLFSFQSASAPTTTATTTSVATKARRAASSIYAPFSP